MRRTAALLPLCVLLAGCGVWGVSVGTSRDDRTPLQKAAQAGDLAEVHRLLASGADPNDPGGAFASPLNFAALRSHNAGVIQALIAAGANPNGRGEDGKSCWVSPLFHAVSINDLDNARALLDAGAASTNSRCSTLAMGWLKPEMMDLLVQRGLDIFRVDEHGRNELHIALAPSTVPRFEAVEYLVRAGVPLNARDDTGKTPLAYWRAPRDFETHRLRMWMFERLTNDPDFRRQREDRAKISALLESAGAKL